MESKVVHFYRKQAQKYLIEIKKKFIEESGKLIPSVKLS